MNRTMILIVALTGAAGLAIGWLAASARGPSLRRSLAAKCAEAARRLQRLPIASSSRCGRRTSPTTARRRRGRRRRGPRRPGLGRADGRGRANAVPGPLGRRRQDLRAAVGVPQGADLPLHVAIARGRRSRIRRTSCPGSSRPPTACTWAGSRRSTAARRWPITSPGRATAAATFSEPVRPHGKDASKPGFTTLDGRSRRHAPRRLARRPRQGPAAVLRVASRGLGRVRARAPGLRRPRGQGDLPLLRPRRGAAARTARTSSPSATATPATATSGSPAPLATEPSARPRRSPSTTGRSRAARTTGRRSP